MFTRSRDQTWASVKNHYSPSHRGRLFQWDNRKRKSNLDSWETNQHKFHDVLCTYIINCENHMQKQLLYIKMDNQPPTVCVQHKELCSILCGSLDERGVCGRMDACVCMAESLCSSPGTITTWLIGYTPIQNMRVCEVASVMSNSLQSHGMQPARLLCPWDSPGKNTGVDCHVLLHEYKNKFKKKEYMYLYIHT